MFEKKEKEDFRDKMQRNLKQSLQKSGRPFVCGNCRNEHMVRNPCEFCILPKILENLRKV